MVEDHMAADIGKENNTSKDIIAENVLEPNISPKANDESSADGASISCEWYPCDFKSNEKSQLIKHIDVHIGQKNISQENFQKDESVEIVDLEMSSIGQKNSEDEEVKETDESRSYSNKHMNTQIEPLFSCDKCDYDSDKMEEVEKHKSINIHNVHYKNDTIDI